ncbi:MAG: hypothetical protein ACRDQG_08085 [Pseudonocardiaceae bacterium]
MESFESFVALALEDEGLVVSEAVKFPVTRQTARISRQEIQTHGFEVDLVGARAGKLVLATVKSFLGSRGVVAEHVTGQGGPPTAQRLYALLNDPVVREAVLNAAAHRYGYRLDQVELRLYVGRFAAPKKGDHERAIREWCTAQRVGAGRIRVVGLVEVATIARRVASRKQYRDNAALTAIKVLDAAGMLRPPESEAEPDIP